MAFETILIEQDEGIVTLSLNRPPVNALNTTVGAELREALDQIDHDSAARAVIITGSGDRAFAAGADIRELQDLAGPDAESMVQRWHHLFRRMETFRLPVIAAVNGVAMPAAMHRDWPSNWRWPVTFGSLRNKLDSDNLKSTWGSYPAGAAHSACRA